MASRRPGVLQSNGRAVPTSTSSQGFDDASVLANVISTLDAAAAAGNLSLPSQQRGKAATLPAPTMKPAAALKADSQSATALRALEDKQKELDQLRVTAQQDRDQQAAAHKRRMAELDTIRKMLETRASEVETAYKGLEREKKRLQSDFEGKVKELSGAKDRLEAQVARMETKEAQLRSEWSRFELEKTSAITEAERHLASLARVLAAGIGIDLNTDGLLPAMSGTDGREGREQQALAASVTPHKDRASVLGGNSSVSTPLPLLPDEQELLALADRLVAEATSAEAAVRAAGAEAEAVGGGDSGTTPGKHSSSSVAFEGNSSLSASTPLSAKLQASKLRSTLQMLGKRTAALHTATAALTARQDVLDKREADLVAREVAVDSTLTCIEALTAREASLRASVDALALFAVQAEAASPVKQGLAAPGSTHPAVVEQAWRRSLRADILGAGGGAEGEARQPPSSPGSGGNDSATWRVLTPSTRLDLRSLARPGGSSPPPGALSALDRTLTMRSPQAQAQANAGARPGSASSPSRGGVTRAGAGVGSELVARVRLAVREQSADQREAELQARETDLELREASLSAVARKEREAVYAERQRGMGSTAALAAAGKSEIDRLRAEALDEIDRKGRSIEQSRVRLDALDARLQEREGAVAARTDALAAGESSLARSREAVSSLKELVASQEAALESQRRDFLAEYESREAGLLALGERVGAARDKLETERQTALSQAAAVLQEARESAAAERADALSLRASVEAEADAVRTELSARREEISALTASCNARRSELASATADAASARAAADEATARATKDLAASLAKLDELRDLELSNDAHAASVQAERAALSSLTLDLNYRQARLLDGEESLAAERAKLNAATAEFEGLRAQAEAAHASAREKAEALSLAQVALEVRTRQLDDMAGTLRVQMGSAESQAVELRRTAADISAQKAEVEAQAASLKVGANTETALAREAAAAAAQELATIRQQLVTAEADVTAGVQAAAAARAAKDVATRESAALKQRVAELQAVLATGGASAADSEAALASARKEIAQLRYTMVLQRRKAAAAVVARWMSRAQAGRMGSAFRALSMHSRSTAAAQAITSASGSAAAAEAALVDLRARAKAKVEQLTGEVAAVQDKAAAEHSVAQKAIAALQASVATEQARSAALSAELEQAKHSYSSAVALTSGSTEAMSSQLAVALAEVATANAGLVEKEAALVDLRARAAAKVEQLNVKVEAAVREVSALQTSLASEQSRVSTLTAQLHALEAAAAVIASAPSSQAADVAALTSACRALEMRVGEESIAKAEAVNARSVMAADKAEALNKAAAAMVAAKAAGEVAEEALRGRLEAESGARNASTQLASALTRIGQLEAQAAAAAEGGSAQTILMRTQIKDLQAEVHARALAATEGANRMAQLEACLENASADKARALAHLSASDREVHALKEMLASQRRTMAKATIGRWLSRQASGQVQRALRAWRSAVAAGPTPAGRMRSPPRGMSSPIAEAGGMGPIPVPPVPASLTSPQAHAMGAMGVGALAHAGGGSGALFSPYDFSTPSSGFKFGLGDSGTDIPPVTPSQSGVSGRAQASQPYMPSLAVSPPTPVLVQPQTQVAQPPVAAVYMPMSPVAPAPVRPAGSAVEVPGTMQCAMCGMWYAYASFKAHSGLCYEQLAEEEAKGQHVQMAVPLAISTAATAASQGTRAVPGTPFDSPSLRATTKRTGAAVSTPAVAVPVMASMEVDPDFDAGGGAASFDFSAGASAPAPAPPSPLGLASPTLMLSPASVSGGLGSGVKSTPPPSTHTSRPLGLAVTMPPVHHPASPARAVPVVCATCGWAVPAVDVEEHTAECISREGAKAAALPTTGRMSRSGSFGQGIAAAVSSIGQGLGSAVRGRPVSRKASADEPGHGLGLFGFRRSSRAASIVSVAEPADLQAPYMVSGVDALGYGTRGNATSGSGTDSFDFGSDAFDFGTPQVPASTAALPLSPVVPVVSMGAFMGSSASGSSAARPNAHAGAHAQGHGSMGGMFSPEPMVRDPGAGGRIGSLASLAPAPGPSETPRTALRSEMSAMQEQAAAARARADSLKAARGGAAK